MQDMTETTAFSFTTLRTFALLCALAICAARASAADSQGAPAISRPSEELKLSFGGPALVKDVPIHEGDHVKVGQVLAQQDERQDRAAYESAKKEADSVAKIDYSTVDKGQKEVQYARKQKLLKDRNASQSEVEEAKLAVDLAATQIELAKLEHEQKILDARRLEVKLEQMKIVSPIEGIIQKVNVGQGEMADPQNRDGAIVVVKNDPLWVEMHLPTAQALQLNLGDKLPVRYPGEKDWQEAKLIFFAPQADAASDTELVRLELPNPAGKASGLQMQVKLPEKVTAVADGGAGGTNP